MVNKHIVIKEKPIQEIREVILEDGSIAEVLTLEEALTELLEAYKK